MMGVFRGIELADLELAGPRLLLRPWRPDDADAVYDVMRDRTMWEYLALPDQYTHDAARTFVTEFAVAGRVAGTAVDSAVVDRATGRLVGSASLRLGDSELHGAEIGYWVARSDRGRGYAAEATAILRDWAFAAGVQRLRLLCDTRNLASVHVALRAGFRFEGIGRRPLPGPDTAPHDPAHADLARFGMIASDPREPVPRAFAPLPEDGLSDGVVALRGLTPADAGPLKAMQDDPVSRRWDLSDTPRSAADTLRETRNAGLQALVGPQLRLVMVDVATGAFAGDLGVRPSPPQVGAIGYSVHPDFRGRGYTTRALRLITAWAFGTAGYARLELGAKIDNIASQRSALNAGFVSEGTMLGRLRNPDGSFSDEAIFALVNPDYAGSASRISP